MFDRHPNTGDFCQRTWSPWEQILLLSCQDVFLSICQMRTVRPLRNPPIIIHGFRAFFITATQLWTRIQKMWWGIRFKSVQQSCRFCHVNVLSPSWRKHATFRQSHLWPATVCGGIEREEGAEVGVCKGDLRRQPPPSSPHRLNCWIDLSLPYRGGHKGKWCEILGIIAGIKLM